MSHKCTNALVRCMDYRLDMSIRNWLDQKGYSGDTDVISIAGSCRSFVSLDNKCAGDYMMAQLDASIKLDETARVILTQHADCSTYGGDTAFETPEAERIKLINDMRALRELVKNKYPDLEIVMVWLKKIDDQNWDFEEIAV